jgi:hypothetical protein
MQLSHLPKNKVAYAVITYNNYARPKEALTSSPE